MKKSNQLVGNEDGGHERKRIVQILGSGRLSLAALSEMAAMWLWAGSEWLYTTMVVGTNKKSE